MRPYPLHFLTSRRYAAGMVDRMEETVSGQPRELRQQIGLRAVHEHLGRIAVGDRAAAASELTLAFSFAEWALAKRAAWRLPKELTEAFLRSSIDELRIIDICPQDADQGYLHFPDAHIQLAGLPGPVEGAYWHHTPGSALNLVFVGRAPEGADAATQAHEGYRVRFLLPTISMPANEAIETALADDIRELEHIRETDAGAAGGEAVLDEAIARHHAAKEGLAKAMRVVLNAFAFRAAYGDDVMLQWPEGAPARMVAQVQHATSPKARERSEDKLWRLGWSPELVLGGQAAQTLREQSSRGHVKSHWRSGHWRNQAYGPQMSLRKLKWIFPMLVGSEAGADA